MGSLYASRHSCLHGTCSFSFLGEPVGFASLRWHLARRRPRARRESFGAAFVVLLVCRSRIYVFRLRKRHPFVIFVVPFLSHSVFSFSGYPPCRVANQDDAFWLASPLLFHRFPLPRHRARRTPDVRSRLRRERNGNAGSNERSEIVTTMQNTETRNAWAVNRPTRAAWFPGLGPITISVYEFGFETRVALLSLFVSTYYFVFLSLRCISVLIRAKERKRLSTGSIHGRHDVGALLQQVDFSVCHSFSNRVVHS